MANRGRRAGTRPRLTSAAKAAINFAAVTARLKPRPFKTKSIAEFFRKLFMRSFLAPG
jgi:hypothetical protein